MKRLITAVIASVTLCIAASGAFAQSWTLHSDIFGDFGTATRVQSEDSYNWTFALNNRLTSVYDFELTLEDYNSGNVIMGGPADLWLRTQIPYDTPAFRPMCETPDETHDYGWRCGRPDKRPECRPECGSPTFPPSCSDKYLNWLGLPMNKPTFTFQTTWDGTDIHWTAWNASLCKPVVCGNMAPVPEPASALAACSILGPVGFVFRRRRK